MKIQGYFPNCLLSAVAFFAGLFVIPLAASGESPGEIWDYIPPTAVCDDRLNVSLTSAGTATVYAQSFDEGSYDNYCLAGVKVRRMDQPYAAFGNAVVFNCNDIGQLVLVELQARDCAGNTNSCWSEVWVEDKLPPQIHCPYNRTVYCHQMNDWYALGQATATDNCGVASITYTDSDNTGSCGTGYITRTWRARDIYGNTSSCTQTIHIIDNTPVVVLFPPDTTFHDCRTADDLDPEDLPAPYNRPRVLYEDCELMAYSHEDWLFTAAPNSCLKIIRRWRVIDWCSYQYGGSQGIWEDNQIIKIQDNTPPVITCPADIVKSTAAGSCRATVALPPLASLDDCLTEVNVRIMGDLGEGSIFYNVPIGEYTMTYVAKDGCLNTSSCSIQVSVVDAVPPGVVCLHGVSLPLMANGEAMLWATDLEIGSSSDNCTPYQHLEFRLGLPPAPGQATPPAADFLTFTCDDRGPNTVALWVGDEAGNWDYCLTTAVVQDNRNICPPMMLQARIAGLVTDEQGDETPGVQIHIDSTATGAYAASTDSLGRYAFQDMPTGASYGLRPEKHGDPREGLSTADIILLAMHIMGADSLDSPYQYIAGDVDRSGVLDMHDVTLIHRLLLGLDNAFPDSITWRFVPESFSFPPNAPLSVGFPERIIINGLAADVADADFIAVRLGDLDASAMIPADSVGARSAPSPLLMEAEEQHVQAGQPVEINLLASGQDAILGLEAILSHDGLSLEDARMASPEGAGGFRAGRGQSTISWAGGRQLALEPQQGILQLRFKAERAGLLSEMLSLDRNARAFRDAGQLQAVPVSLRFVRPGEGLRLAEAFPNPFRDKACIRFELPAAGSVSLKVWDARGRLVFQTEQGLDKGRHELMVNAARLGAPGAYLFRLASGFGEASGRLVVLPGN